jgi:hypothetical protein
MKRPERSLVNRPSRRARTQHRGTQDDRPCRRSVSTALVLATGPLGYRSGVTAAWSCACRPGLRGRRSGQGDCGARLGCGEHRLPQDYVRRPRAGKHVIPGRQTTGWSRGLVSQAAGVAPDSIAEMPRLVVFRANRRERAISRFSFAAVTDEVRGLFPGATGGARCSPMR